MLVVAVTFGGLLLLGYLTGRLRPLYRARYWAEGYLFFGITEDTGRLRHLRHAVLHVLLPDVLLLSWWRARRRTPQRPARPVPATVHRPHRRPDEEDARG